MQWSIKNNIWEGCFCGIMAKVLNCYLKVSTIKLQLYCYVHLLNSWGKALKALIQNRYDSILAVILQGWL